MQLWAAGVTAAQGVFQVEQGQLIALKDFVLLQRDGNALLGRAHEHRLVHVQLEVEQANAGPGLSDVLVDAVACEGLAVQQRFDGDTHLTGAVVLLCVLGARRRERDGAQRCDPQPTLHTARIARPSMHSVRLIVAWRAPTSHQRAAGCFASLRCKERRCRPSLRAAREMLPAHS